MTALEDALEIVLAATSRLEAEEVRLEISCGRWLAEDVQAGIALPSFDQSAMDGYAVRAQDVTVGGRLKVVGEQTAGGKVELVVGEREAVRIFTGARLPTGADTVIMQEEARQEGKWVFFSEKVTAGEFVRRAGEEVCLSQKLAAKGTRISPPIIGLLAAQGRTHLRVGKRVQVGVLSTGDELIARGGVLLPGQIYESNGLMLGVAMRELGCAVAGLGVATDEKGDLAAKLEEGLKQDVLVISGGVSVGERDLVKAQLAALGARQHLWRVAMKPGKPFLFASRGSCLIFGLPGNPVASWVTWLLLVRPALLQMMGATELGLPRFAATMSIEYQNAGKRPEFVRGNLCEGVFTPEGRQESHALFGLSRANALVRVESGQKLGAGEKVMAIGFE